MKNFLRYSFVVLMAMLFGKVCAQEVTLDFTLETEEGSKTSVWGFPAGSSNKTVEEKSFTYGGYTVKVAGSEGQGYYWHDKDHYLLFGKQGATLTLPAFDFDVERIEIEGNSGASAGVKQNIFVGETEVSTETTGAQGTNTFEIAAANQAAGNIYVIKVNSNHNNQIKTIKIWKKGTTDNPDNPDDPDSKSLLDKFDFTSGTITDNGDQTVFEFAGKAPMGETGEKIDITGKMLFDFENNICTACKALVTFPSEVIAVLAEADAKANADKDGFASVERDGATLTVVSSRDFLGYSRILIKATLRLLIGAETMGLGILESPMSPSQANMLAGGLGADEVLDQDVYIKGKIANIKYEFSAQYGTATFFISADGKDEYTFQCYSVYTLENKPWVEGNTQIKVGDEVIICGKVTNFKGTTPETASKQAYIYSLNGVTKNEGGSETPDTPNEITVAKALEIIAALEDGKTTSEEYIIKGIVTAVDEISTSYGNATFDIADNAGDATVLKVFRAKDAEGQKITDENIVKVGDEVVVQGKLQKYVKNDVVTPEVAQNGKILTVNGQSTGITILKATQVEAPLYNLAGQRVDANYKGVVIKNGQKMIQK